MSDSPAPSAAPSAAPQGPSTTRHVSSLVVWLLVLVVAAVAFGAVVVASGGIGGVMKMLGLSPATVSAPTPPSAPAASVVPTAPVSAVASSPGLPAEAQNRMYTEQLQSQAAIKELLDKKVSIIRVGTPSASGPMARVPVTVVYKSGPTYSGTMALRKYGRMWYFFSLTAASAAGGGNTPAPTAFDSAVVAAITGQQATPANQHVLVDGVLGGGFKTIKVTGVAKGAGTATVNVLLSGGTAKPTAGRLVCISKIDGTTPYWFIARFDAR